MVNDARWLLALAWPFIVLAASVATKNVASFRRTALVMSVAALSAAALVWLYKTVAKDVVARPAAKEVVEVGKQRGPISAPRGATQKPTLETVRVQTLEQMFDTDWGNKVVTMNRDSTVVVDPSTGQRLL